MMLNDFNITVKEIDDEIWCDFYQIYAAIKNTGNLSGAYKLMKSIGIQYIQKIKKGRNSWYFINSDGISRLFGLVRNIPITKINEYINLLNQNGFNVKLMKTSKEEEFYSDLWNIMTALNHVVKQHQKIELSYGTVIVDFLIDNSVIAEYDENNHKNYDRDKEKLREAELKGLGYKFIRLSDRNSNSENIARIIRIL